MTLTKHIAVLFVLFILSGFFAMAETAMMACNRHRLRHLAEQGHRGAKIALSLLGQTDKLLGLILLGNTLINAAAATLTGYVALALFGHEKWALEAGTLMVTLCLLVFAEITPKVIGASYPDWLTHRIGFILAPLLRIGFPIIWFVNLFVTALLKLTGLEKKPELHEAKMTAEELRSIVLESSHFIPPKHKAILLNLFELESITVEDIMVPRGEIEALDVRAPIETLRYQLATSFHSRLPVYDGDPGNIIGILMLSRLFASAMSDQVDEEHIRSQLTPPYFIPSTTPIYTQLQFFQENRQRIGLVVDEYGEIQGLVTLTDIVEELIGKFASGIPHGDMPTWDENGTVLVDGARNLRDLNRSLGIDFPLDGPRTLNGLILEYLQDIPESEVSIRLNGIAMDIVQTQDRRIKVVRLLRPAPIKGEL